MLELIKAIIGPIAKSLSLSDLLEARKKGKANEIGTELFLLYASLNDILVVGRRIGEELEEACSWMERRLGDGTPNRTCPCNLDTLLRQQSLHIARLVGSINRLGLKLQVISPQVYLRLLPLIWWKRAAVDELFDAISGERGNPKLVSIDANRLQTALDDADRILSSLGDDLGFGERYNRLVFEYQSNNASDLYVAEPIHDLRSIPIKQHFVLRAFLVNHNPAAVLDDLERAAQSLRDALEKNFSMRDILLNVGDGRAALTDGWSGKSR